MSNSNEVAGIDWSNERLLPGFQMPEHLDIYDIRSASPDVQLAITTLVGLINRPQPEVYLLSRKDDAFWLEKCFTSLFQELSPLTGSDIFASLLTTYRSIIEGFIIYDPDLIDSINIATMLASQENGVVISPALAQQLQDAGFALSTITDLRTYRWKSRLQAYQWAYQHLLHPASSHLIAGLDPTIMTGIRSFLVATRTFIYWLDPRNILPDLRAGGRSEYRLMQELLHAFAPGTAHMGWFINEGVGTLLSSLSAHPVLASDFASNMEVWASLPAMLPPAQPIAAITNPPRPEPHKIYVSFTFSEGDNLQYIQERMAYLWRDPMRGSIPIGWPISPVLIEAAPAMAAYYVNTATEHDELLAGPSGAGYMYPSFWPPTQLPAFLTRTGRLMQDMNLKALEVLDANVLQSIPLSLRAFFTGAGMALINKDIQQRFSEGLSPFKIRGILSGGGQSRASWRKIAGMPIYQNIGIAKSVSQAISQIKAAAQACQQRPYFLNLYVLAWTMTPSDLKQVSEQLGDEYEVVTPGTLLAMLPEN